MTDTYIGIMNERLDECGRCIEKEFFIKFIKSNYEFRIILGISYIGNSDIRILNSMRECILDIIPESKEDCFRIFIDFVGNSDLIKIFHEKLREIKNTTYKQLYKENFKEFIQRYLNDLGYTNVNILCKDYYE